VGGVETEVGGGGCGGCGRTRVQRSRRESAPRTDPYGLLGCFVGWGGGWGGGRRVWFRACARVWVGGGPGSCCGRQNRRLGGSRVGPHTWLMDEVEWDRGKEAGAD